MIRTLTGRNFEVDLGRYWSEFALFDGAYSYHGTLKDAPVTVLQHHPV